MATATASPSISELIQAGRVFGERCDVAPILKRFERDGITQPLIPVLQRTSSAKGEPYVSREWAIVTGSDAFTGEPVFRTYSLTRSGRVMQSWVSFSVGFNFQLEEV